MSKREKMQLFLPKLLVYPTLEKQNTQNTTSREPHLRQMTVFTAL
jgi:hypothetical protein